MGEFDRHGHGSPPRYVSRRPLGHSGLAAASWRLSAGQVAQPGVPEPVAQGVAGQADFGAQCGRSFAGNVPAMQVGQFHHDIARRDDVDLSLRHDTGPAQFDATEINARYLDNMQRRTFVHSHDNTAGSGAAIIPAMKPIRSSSPGRPYLEVGQRIEATRLWAGLTVIQMAELMRTTPPRYSDLQYGRALPDTEKVEPLCVRYGVTLDWIYRDDERLMPVGIIDGIKAHLRTLVDAEGKPLKRKPGRPKKAKLTDEQAPE